MNTILTTQLFNQYCNDYYLTNKTNALNKATLATLPTTIKNVELSLNTMLNGRLYKQYNPSNLQFNGVGNLSASAEQDTLYSLLTEAVLYRIQTGAFVNVSNTFGGNITGLNHFQSSNSNVIGLRNDIRDKLVALNLYKNANYTNPTVNQPPQLLNDNPLTIEQASAINSWLSTNNFTLGGNWDFANLLIDGIPIQTYIDNQNSGSGANYNSILINYLPNTPIPSISPADVDAWSDSVNTTTMILQNYWTNQTILPLITPNDIANWNTAYNNTSPSFDGVSEILTNYITKKDPISGISIPLINSDDITNWNNAYNYANINNNILQNYGENEVLPVITSGLIDSWNTAAINVDLNTRAINNFNNVLNNYLPRQAVPLINSFDIKLWNDTNTYASDILQNYWPRTQIPIITQADITNWNNNNTILKNYSSSSEVPLITSPDINNWNATSTTQTKILNVLKNYYGTGQNVIEVPTITQADITKWNSNSGSSSGSTVTRTTYTLTITNTWQLEFNAQNMVLNETNTLVSPDPTTNNLTINISANTTLPAIIPTLILNIVPDSSITILSIHLYPGIATPILGTWTNLLNINLPSGWNFSSSLNVYNNNYLQTVWGNWSIYQQPNIPPIYLPFGQYSPALQYNYYVQYSGGTAPNIPNQTITEINTLMLDVVWIG